MSCELSLTLVALAWNEGEELRSCFSSLRLLCDLTGAHTLLVLNSDADPRTRQVAHDVADRVVEADFENFSKQRNRALDLATTVWVFFIDADEVCTKQLAVEIKSVLEKPEHTAYRVPRRNFLFGHEVRHTGWWPDYQIRLLHRASSRYDESRQVHELPQVIGTIGTLKSPLIHNNYKTWAQFAAKQRSYAVLEAQARYAQGNRARVQGLIGQPWREFKRRFCELEGYKDGLLGLALSLAMAGYALDVQRRLLRLQR